MKKLRLSYSLLEAWKRGETDQAISTYFRVSGEPTPQMIEGKEIHEQIAEHINKFNTLPDFLIEQELKIPSTEMEVTVPYNELFDLKAVYDCYDSPTLYEWKTGVQPSITWTRTHQLPFYFLVGELGKLKIDRAILVRYNQYDKSRDFAIVHNSKTLRDKARNYIDSYGPEIYEFFSREGLV